MPKESTTTKHDRTLEVHVLSPAGSKGESIVLRLPDGKYGVVDCYARNRSKPESNATLSFLKDRGVSDLEFLCLTHPHDDHFRGMTQILKQLSVRQFWRFEGINGDILLQMLAHMHEDARRSGDVEAITSSDELQLILEEVDKRLKKSRTAKGQHEQHNIISSALLIEFGKTRVVLGGDVEKPGWRDAINVLGSKRFAAHMVKVSHHGSTNGYCDGLWRHHAQGGPPRAVVTPWMGRLPQREALEHISEFASSIATTNVPAVLSSKATQSTVSLKSRLVMRHTFKARSIPAAHGYGRCTTVFDSEGNCVETEHRPPAGELKLQAIERTSAR